MKVLFDHCNLYNEDDHSVKLGINWYKHAPQNSKKFKAWKGFTFTFYLIYWQVNLTYISDYDAYKARLNYRYSDHIKSLSIKRTEKNG